MGGGFQIESFERAMSWKPHFIGCDAGSTDPGPHYLGTGDTQFSLQAITRDLELMILAARQAKIPLLIGSAQTGGSDEQLERVVEVAEGIARKHDLRFRLGVVHSEPSRDYLKQKFREGKIVPLANAPEIDETIFDRSKHIVAMAGVEPFQAALAQGADVVISGRSSDASIFSAIPSLEGFPPGPVWHAAKILECSAASVVQRKYPDPLFAWIREDHFVVEPPNPDYRCTPVSVASHNLYENGSPFELVEPAGTLFSDESTYEAVNDRSVRVSGSRFEPSTGYTVKLEGVESVGFQTILVGGVRDPVIIRQLDSWLDGMMQAFRDRATNVFGAEAVEQTHVVVRRYGIDGTMGSLEPTPTPGHEVGLIFEVTAETQELANGISKSLAHIALHYPVPEWTGLITTLALPYSPHELDRGEVYRFNLNHVLQLDDPLEPFSVETRNV
jgi:hypothetical protein